MHRTTPLANAFVSYVAGGARATVDKMTDTTQMQEMAGSFMKFENRGKIESPQNYGFTSHNFGAEKDGDGKMTGSAETFISFMGGNRSFPVAGPIDDRRHRLNSLDEGDTAMFRGKGDKAQFHMAKDGNFWSGPRDRPMRMALIDEDSESNKTQQSGGQGGSGSGSGGGGGGGAAAALALSHDVLDIASPGTLDSGGGSGGSGSGSSSGAGGQQKKGQQSVKDKNTKSQRAVYLTKDETACSGNNVRFYVGQASSGGGSSGGGGGSGGGSLAADRAGSSGGSGGQSKATGLAECNQDMNMYCGALKDKGQFALVVTLKGPTKNVYGKIG